MRGTPPTVPSSIVLLAVALAGVTPGRQPASLVVGVQSEPMGGMVSAMHVVVKAGGAVVADDTMKAPVGSRAGFPRPWERTVPAVAGSEVDVEVEAYGAEGAPPLFTRLASTRFQPPTGGATTPQLLRVPLESRCMVFPPNPHPGKVPGRLSGPTCTPPLTCIAGVCQSSVVPASSLEPYVANWPINVPDRCKPANAGPPVLQVGTGQTGYLPLVPEQTLQAEAGPQGGHHIWIAVRMKNLKQSGSTTKISGLQPGTDTPIPPSTFVFTFSPDDGSYCKLYGLRYQLDNGGIDYKQFLGKPLDVTVTVTDPAGATATSTAHIQVAPTLVNP